MLELIEFNNYICISQNNQNDITHEKIFFNRNGVVSYGIVWIKRNKKSQS